MIIEIKFPNNKVRNKEALKESINEFCRLFNFIDVCVDLSDVKIEGKPSKRRKK